ncbi:MAG: mandelate racemase/muconate lactonizing enzyme family protein [Verrucomicrobiales bacterium]|nr:mandelate racemase/muconate lactonizing enzyme family protein [Verrucomicrobiales bacterium]
MPKIIELDAYVVSVPAEGNAFGERAEETLLVKVTDEDGLVGIGECVAAPAVTKAMVDMPTLNGWSQGIKNIVLGAEPLDRLMLYDQVYHNSFLHGRRGILIHALSAVDIAIHDLAAKQIGKPVYSLLGGARTQRLRPYATLYPGDIYGNGVDGVISEIGRQTKIAIEQGLRAVKVPVLFYEHLPDRDLPAFVRDCREMIGSGIEIGLDFGYRWIDWQDAAWVLKRVEAYDILFAEAPLRHDNLLGHARLTDASPIRVGGGEFATGRWEIREWLETAKVSLVQPGISRAGGFVELMRIAEMCELYGAILVPHSYATGITDTCNLHLQAANLTIPMFEFRSPRLGPSRLRSELVDPAEPEIRDGYIALPQKAGLGIQLNEELVQNHAL